MSTERATRSSAGPVRRRAADAGSVTAETAVAMPALVLLLAAGLWAVSAAAAQLACVDAARLGARAAARGEDPGQVRQVAAAAAPRRAVITVRRDADLTRVEVSVAVHPPLLAGLPALTVRAAATAATEPGVAARPPAPRVPTGRPPGTAPGGGR